MAFTGKSRLLVAVTAAALTLTACGGTEKGTATTPGAATGAPAASADAKGSAFDSLKGLTDAVKQKSSTKSSTHMVMNITAGPTEIDAEGDVTFGSKTSMQMTMTVPTVGDMEMRLVERILYVKMPANLAPNPAKPWMKVDLDGTSQMAKQMSGMLDQAEQSDPTKTLEQLADAGEITGHAEDTVDGQKATRYTIKVEVAKLKDKALGMSEEALATVQQAGIKDFTANVWINEDNLPIRYTADIPVQGQKVKTDVKYTDWGKSVTIEAPPASQTTEAP
ncbi:hypothetical protein [Actinokineospora enzanensis]|uniref:hypothetical protein n=1 Tax=Actinokineospora enzanensis TaxID=155975 RepID=UPI0003738B97|nr:hypothetical protein [Actinokineospora enzanensis]